MALSNLYIFNYNTYFNRIVKREETFEDYGEPMFVMQGVNFNMADGVDTQIVWGKNNQAYHGQGNYLIEYDDDYGMLLSRWFITDANYNRQGQWVLTLRRDLLADFYNNVIEAPMMVNRGMVNHTNPLVFNDEGFSFNQIKKSETLLQDSKNSLPYIVLYASKNIEVETGISVDTTFTGTFDVEISTPLENSIYNAGTYNTSAQSMDLLFQFTAQYSTHGVSNNWRFYKYRTLNGNLVDDGASPYPPSVSPITQSIISNNTTGLKNPLNTALSSSHMTQVLNAYKGGQTGKISDADMVIYDNIISRGGIKVKDSTGKFYQITATKTTKTNSNVRISPSVNGYNNLVDYIQDEFPQFTPNDTEPSSTSYYPFYATTTEYEYTLYAEYLVNETFTVDVDPTGKVHTDDSECIVMLFPYENVRLLTGNVYSYVDKETQLNIARTIARKYTNTVIYDMQLLPYAPPSIQKYLSEKTYDLRNADSSQITTFTYNDETKGIMFWADVANFSFDISLPISVNNTAIDYKIGSNCDLWRLCSPNYNGQFEFNVAKNGGVNYFNIDVTYRPYNPYIHVNPNFKGIYGTDYDDARGLICQGDFSLPITGDAFAQYELNNKNYLNVFNREIQHMEFTQRQERIASGVQVGVGTVQGAVTGAAAGGSVGGMYGAIAGAAVGLAASGIGGAVDISMMNARQREDRAYAKDMFSYQLGNIKALPYSLNKVTPLTWNNKIFPFIEYYTCTDEEKEILRNRIKYDSMKLECIDTLENLMLNYTEDNDIHFYSGNIIRLEGVDNHESEAIYEEIKKGAYF